MGPASTYQLRRTSPSQLIDPSGDAAHGWPAYGSRQDFRPVPLKSREKGPISGCLGCEGTLARFAIPPGKSGLDYILEDY